MKGLLRKLLFALGVWLTGWTGCNLQNEYPQGPVMNEPDYEKLREKMVREQIQARGVKDPDVLTAMRKVPRHKFVPENMRRYAYEDCPLPIGYGQTISQPYIVAFMTEQLRVSPGMRVLEIGTGSGYQAAVLAEMGANIYTIEIIPELAERARAVLLELGYTNVHVKVGDGYKGWPEHAPYDGIIVTCAPESIPQALVDQLKQGGRMVIPVGPTWDQELVVVEKENDKISYREVLPVRFVPMVPGESTNNESSVTERW